MFWDECSSHRDSDHFHLQPSISCWAFTFDACGADWPKRQHPHCKNEIRTMAWGPMPSLRDLICSSSMNRQTATCKALKLKFLPLSTSGPSDRLSGFSNILGGLE